MEGSKGMLLGMCNPLLDISANVGSEMLEKYGLQPSNAILAEEKHMPLYEELVKEHQVEYIAGGAGLNSIRAAAWMLKGKGITGACRYMGCIGKDEFGTEMRKGAERDGVETHFLEDPDVPTGTCAVLITEKDRSMVANLSAANKYKKEHFDENFALVEEAKFFYITGFFLNVSFDSVLTLGQHAASTDKPLLMNLSAPFIIEFFWESLEKVLPYVDVVFCNEHEAAALGKKLDWGSDLQEIAKKAAALPKENSKRPRTVIFTQGSKEVIIVENGELRTVPTPLVPAEEIVDFNGAGDCFVGGFLAAYTLGKTTEQCIAAAQYCAGVCIRTSGIKFIGTSPFFNENENN